MMNLQKYKQRISQELSIQSQRYSRTRYGKLAALLLYLAVFKIVPLILNIIIPFLSLYLSIEMVYVVIALSFLLSTSVVMNLILYFIYMAKLPFFEQYRINSKLAWPWQKQRQQDQQEWHTILLRSIKITSFGIIFIGGLSLFIQTKLNFKIVMDMNLTPCLSAMIPQFIIMMFIEDSFFFFTHWTFHQPLFYRFHKVHHEYTTTISVAGLHFHPIQFFITQSLSALVNESLTSLYMPVHISTLISWFFFRLWDAYTAHSGYIFSWNPIQVLPFCINDQYHDFHHSQNCGNYGSHFRFWDSVFDTNKEYRLYRKKRTLEQQKLDKNK